MCGFFLLLLTGEKKYLVLHADGLEEAPHGTGNIKDVKNVERRHGILQN